MSIIGTSPNPNESEIRILCMIAHGEIPLHVGLSGDPSSVFIGGFRSREVPDFFESLGVPTFPIESEPSVNSKDELAVSPTASTESRRELLLLAVKSTEEASKYAQGLSADRFAMAIVLIQDSLSMGSTRANLHRHLMRLAPAVSIVDAMGLRSWSRRARGPELSVVVPIYGVEAQLPELLERLDQVQTSKSLEVVLVDDGSTDRSGRLALEWAAGRKGTHVIQQDNAGCWAARNRGLRMATGDYIMFVDGDDLVSPEGLRELMDAALMTGADVVRGEWTSFRDDRGSGDIVDYDKFPHSTVQWNARPRSAFLHTAPAIWRNLYRRDFLTRHQIEFPPFPRFDDLPFQFQVSRHIESLVDVPTVVYHYRLSREGQDTAATDKRLFVHFEIFNWLESYVASQGNAGDYRDLVGVRLASDYWVLQRLDSGLRRAYAQRVVYELAYKKRPFSRLDTAAGLAKRTRTWGSGQVLRALGRLTRSLIPQVRRSPPGRR